MDSESILNQRLYLELNLINDEIELINKEISNLREQMINITNLLEKILNKISLYKIFSHR